MLTVDKSAQATRSVIGVIPLQIISAVGLYYLLITSFKVNKTFSYFSIGLIVVTIIFSFLNYFNLYFVKYPLYSSDFWGWQFGARDIVNYFTLKEKQYDDLIMAPEFNAPEIFFKFYAPLDCTKCRIGLPENLHNSYRQQLFAVTPAYLLNHPSLRFTNLKTIYYPDNSVAFRVGNVVQ